MPRLSLILLNRVNISPQKKRSIISHLNNPEEIFKVKRSDLENFSFLNKEDIDKILKERNSSWLKKELTLIKQEGIEVIDIFSNSYPELLKEIPVPPLVLYIKGRKEVCQKNCFAIVGTRIPSLYGLSMASRFAYTLACVGLVIVSGLARGIDTAAHKAALKGGETVAVLGSGLLNLYPRENKKLAREIEKRGAVISEFPLTTPPLKENFPRRNRIISGLSQGVLVVEATKRSGALITARLACEQNREVFSLPGKVDSPLSSGPHTLIKQGAKLVDSVEDILEELNIKFVPSQEKMNLNPEEEKVLATIGEGGVCLEEIISKSLLVRELVNKALLTLQLKGFIKEVRPSYFVRVV